MKALQVDFLGRRRASTVGGAVIFAVGLIALAVSFNSWRAAERDKQYWAQQAQESSTGRRAAFLGQRDRDGNDPLVKAQTIIHRIGFPWGRVFVGVESARIPQVTLVELEQDAQSGHLRLTAEASDDQAIFDYVERLAAIPGFGDVRLISQGRDEVRNTVGGFTPPGIAAPQTVFAGWHFVVEAALPDVVPAYTPSAPPSPPSAPSTISPALEAPSPTQVPAPSLPSPLPRPSRPGANHVQALAPTSGHAGTNS